MDKQTASGWPESGITQGGLSSVLWRWRQHEWRSLQGHRLALLTRWSVARRARNLGQLIHDQVDLLPESRRRFRRNAETRRAILRELGMILRRAVQAQG